ncbi:MAG: hypothetical protein SVZ03_06280 [Spirochaetota bacterium]|nr:hypothetical protein [Spirochaetota bacterium]
MYNVECAFNKEHIFEKVIEIEEGSEDSELEMQAYCPFCDELMNIKIQEKAVSNAAILRKFDNY